MIDNIRRFERGECRQIRRLLDDFLSDALSIETNQQILAHLENCVPCAEERQYRSRLRSALASGWNSVPSPRNLQLKVEKQLLLSGRLRSLPFHLAATFLFSVIGVALYFTFVGQPRLTETDLQIVDHYRFAVQDHLNCSRVPELSQTRSVENYSSNVKALIEQITPKHKFVGVMECDLDETTFTHYIFRDSTGSLSVMIEGREQNESLPKRGSHREFPSFSLHTVREGPFILASLETSRHFVYIIGDGFTHEQTDSLAEEMAPFLSEALLEMS